jgi:hypothetical protein
MFADVERTGPETGVSACCDADVRLQIQSNYSSNNANLLFN